MPGLSGNGSTGHTVVFMEDGPRLICGKNRRGKRPAAPRTIVRAWGFNKRTVEIQVPLTSSQCEQIDARLFLIAQQDAWRERGDLGRRRHAEQQPYRATGNVIYLLPRAEGRAAP